MDTTKLVETRSIVPEIDAFSTYVPLPGLGVLPINAFLIRSAEPVLVDTLFAAVSDDFMRALRSRIALDELRFIWLTHPDVDHVGSLARVLAEAPRARVVTTFLGMGKMGLLQLPVPLRNPSTSCGRAR
jgi:flavorubredoxin